MKPRKKDRSCIRRAVGNQYTFMGRVWIEGNEGAFLGHGRILLLERIRQYGSISKAARSMGMSYRHAWAVLESMNRQSKMPLIEKIAGGEGGGGTRLTDEGEKVVSSFTDMDERFAKFLSAEAKRFNL
jgi:molybdate transport system regulatory protein